jgi:cephalosporin hydroxylase
MAIVEQVNRLSTAAVLEYEAQSPNGAPVPAFSFEIEGHIDTFARGWIEGWAWAPALPGQAVIVEAVMDGRVLASTLAGIYRSDLAEAGKRNGWCAFALCLLEKLQVEGELHVRVRGAADKRALYGSPLRVDRSSLETARDASTQLPQRHIAFSANDEVNGGIDGYSGDILRGWLHWRDGRPDSVELSIWEDGNEIARADACEWRCDLAELRQGDGACGFKIALPEGCRDGRLHALDFCLPDTGRCLLARPLMVKSKSAPAGSPPSGSALTRLVRLNRPLPLFPAKRSGEAALSVIVNFYNMRREAARTLASLTRSYQRQVWDLPYEVLCIDNGSDPPLERAWVESYGPEFRLIRPENPQPSPCSAINAAAAQASGEYLAIMIDGAHVLTPGVLHEAMSAFKEQQADLVAVRYWFIGGDQRWLACSGYTREMEDRLFARIHWPKRGYEMFRIGAPIGETSDPWLGGLFESNCLFMPAALYARIGGMDEAFSRPGGGFANIDFLWRAAAEATRDIVCLVGEATFHQYHEGTTTNVSDDEMNARVRTYDNDYRLLRGEGFQSVEPERLRLRGSIRHEHAVGIRHRPLLPMSLGVTGQVRPGSLPHHFASGAQQYLQSVYTECGLHRQTQWLGQKVELAPADLVALENIIGRMRPARVITTCVKDGLIRFLVSMLELHGLSQSCVVAVGAPPPGVGGKQVRAIEGHPAAPQTMRLVEEAIGAEEATLVLFEPAPEDLMPVDMLAAYARFVSYRSYLVFVGTVLGQPWLGYSNRWYLTAIRRFLAGGAPFVIDHSYDQQLTSICASGYLRRTGHAICL